MSVGGSRFDFSNHINTPHRKRPRSRQDAYWNWRYMYFVSIYLAFVTCSGVMMAVCFHGRPVITCSQDLFSHCMSTGMSTEGTIVYFFHDLFCFLLVYTAKQSRVMVAFV